VQSLLETLSPEEKTQSRRFHQDFHRQRYIQAHGLLRLLISRYTAITPRCIRISTGQSGKPFLKKDENTIGLQFNISHSECKVAYAFTLEHNLGIDIEMVRHDSDFISLAARYFTRAEHESLSALPDEKKVKHFFQLWTRKEAFLKAKGTGLSLGLLGQEFTDTGTAVIDLDISEGYVGAVAFENLSDRANRLVYHDWSWCS
jgi:4'-phosphopantetheinyl transferase